MMHLYVVLVVEFVYVNDNIFDYIGVRSKTEIWDSYREV